MDLEPTLALLSAQRLDDYGTWETRYGLLLWLSIIVLIPFDLATVDSTVAVASHGAKGAASASATSGSSGGMIAHLLELGKGYLSDTGPARDMAAVMLARFFSR